MKEHLADVYDDNISEAGITDAEWSRAKEIHVKYVSQISCNDWDKFDSILLGYKNHREYWATKTYLHVCAEHEAHEAMPNHFPAVAKENTELVRKIHAEFPTIKCHGGKDFPEWETPK